MLDLGYPDWETITRSRTSWRFEIGPLKVARTREAYTVGQPVLASPASAPRRIWPLAIGTFASVSAFGLFVVATVASEPPVPRQPRYLLSIPVPAPAAKPALVAPTRLAKPKAAATLLPSTGTLLSGTPFGAGDEPHVVAAMRTGELQEWAGPDGQRRFLNAGPLQADSGKQCRDLALLVREPSGSNQVHSARRCIAATRRDEAVEGEPDAQVQQDATDPNGEAADQ